MQASRLGILRVAVAAMVLAGAGALGGCILLGIAASKVPPRTVPPAYGGMAEKTAVVWVWIDPAVDLDYPRLSLDIASKLQENLELARDGGNTRQKKELKNLRFPILPESVVKHQKRDPTLNLSPIIEIAPRLEVERLIYVEVSRFTTQGGATAGLMRGVADVNLSVIEVDLLTRQSRVGYQEHGLRALFPPTGPAEGSMTLSARNVYEGLTTRIADEASLRFVSHAEQEPQP